MVVNWSVVVEGVVVVVVVGWVLAVGVGLIVLTLGVRSGGMVVGAVIEGIGGECGP